MIGRMEFGNHISGYIIESSPIYLNNLILSNKRPVQFTATKHGQNLVLKDK